MSNLKNPPLFLTPQVTRGLIGIGHPKRVAQLEVKSLHDVTVEAKASRNRGGAKMPKPLPKTGFIVVHRDGQTSAPMSASAFTQRDEAGIGFWRIRAKVKIEQQCNAVVDIPQSSQRGGPLPTSTPPASLASPFSDSIAGAAEEPSVETRRVAASEPAVSINAVGSGAIIGIDMAKKPDVSVETDFVDGMIVNMRVCAPTQVAGKPAKLDAFAARIIEIHGMAKPSASNTGQPRRLVSGSSL